MGPQSTRMDAADASFYLSKIRQYADKGTVKVVRIREGIYEISWTGMRFLDMPI